MPRRPREGFWLDTINDTGIWYIHFHDSRRHRIIRRSSGETDRQKAEIKLAEFILAYNRPDHAEPEDVLIAQVLNAYLIDHASKIPSAEQAAIAADRLLTFFNEDRVSSITLGRQREYIESRPVSAGTVDRELSVLRAALRHCWKDGMIKSVPYIVYAQTATDRRDVEPKGRPLSLQEVAMLFDAARDHAFMYMLLGVSTLARPDAILDLSPAQIDQEHGLINLNPRGRRQTKKFRPIVPIVPTLAPWLETKTGRFVHYYRKPIKSIKTAWRKVRAEAGLDDRVQPYSLRHTMARELRKAKVPDEEIRIYLGHQRVDTTITYAPYDPDYLNRAAEVVENTLQTIGHLLRRNSFHANNAQMAETREYILKGQKRRNPKVSLGVSMVGAAGIEPATPTMST